MPFESSSSCSASRCVSAPSGMFHRTWRKKCRTYNECCVLHESSKISRNLRFSPPIGTRHFAGSHASFRNRHAHRAHPTPLTRVSGGLETPSHGPLRDSAGESVDGRLNRRNRRYRGYNIVHRKKTLADRGLVLRDGVDVREIDQESRVRFGKSAISRKSICAARAAVGPPIASSLYPPHRRPHAPLSVASRSARARPNTTR